MHNRNCCSSMEEIILNLLFEIRAQTSNMLVFFLLFCGILGFREMVKFLEGLRDPEKRFGILLRLTHLCELGFLNHSSIIII